MSKQSKTLDIELSIASRLWYTASVIISCTNVNVNNIKELESLIRSAIVSQNDRQYHWTSHKLLSKIIKSKHTSGECDIDAELVTIQFNNALKLTCCVPKYLEENPLSFINVHNLTDTEYKQTVDFIIKNFQENPDILCWILNHLYVVQCDNAPKAANSFTTLCMSAFKEFIRDSSVESLNTPCTGNKNYNHKFIGKLMCILAKLDILEYDESARLTLLYPTLFEICDVRDVEFALYARKEQKLLNEWLSYVNELYGRSIDPNTLTNAVKICKAILKSGTNSSSQLYAEELLFRIIGRKQHWLLDILDLCCTLAINKDYDNVQLFMQQLSHGCLWPSLLLKVLQGCSKDDNGLLQRWEDNILMCDVLKHLLDMCNFESWHNSSLSKFDATLRDHIKVIEWILLHTKSGSSTENNSSVQVRSPIMEPVITVKYVLQILQNFSTLAVLKKTIDIHEANYNDIQHLLTNVSQEKNTFLAYCSLALSIKAILLCEYYDTEYKHVTECFQKVESYLQALFPLSVRLEAIENIFCLLFLRQENFDDRTRFSQRNNVNTSNEYSDIESTSIELACMSFICNKYAVREVLYHLQNCMQTADTDYTQDKENGLGQNPDAIQNKINVITKRIADANWRLELCTNTTFIKNVGIFDGMHKNSDLTRKHTTITSDKAGFPYSPKTSTPFYDEDDSSTYEPKKRSDSSSDTTLAVSSGRPRRRTRNTASVGEFLTLRDNSQRSSFINFMLASNDSLVLQCLQKGRYEKAEEVIEVADMKNSHLYEKVRFSKAMQVFRQCLFKDADELDMSGQSKDSPKISTLESIRLAAQEGIQSSRHTNQLETFLASQETHLRAFTSDGTQNNETLTLSALDLALTMSRTHKIANSFCDVAMKHLKLCNSLENTEHAHFFSKICQLMNENKNEMTVTNILCDAQIPLSIKEWEEKREFWNELTIACKEFCESNNVNNNVDDTAINATYLRESKILRKITSICGSNEKYLQNIYSHLQLLHTIIPTSFDGTQTFTMSNALKIPLHYFFGHQIFDLCIEPHKLETIAHNLQVNLVHTILTNTCPNIPCCNNSLYITKKSYTGCIILNENCHDTSDLENITSDSPNQCIARILEELLQVLRRLSENKPIFTRTDLKNVAENSNMQAALNKTSRLTSLDLSELSVGNETMAFFINLWNVMYIHAAVSVWSNDVSCNRLNHDISLMSTGYVIGDLGLVTLAALRAKLLDGLVPVYKYFNQIEELNEAVWQDLDLVQNPKVLFAMAHEFCKTPRIRVLDAKALDHDLDEAVRDYMNHYTSQFTDTDFSNKLSKDVIESLHNLSAKGRLNINSENLINDEENANSSKALLISIENILVEYKNSDVSCLVALNYTNNINIESMGVTDSAVMIHEQNRVIKDNLLQYLEGHCWLLSYLVQRMYDKHSVEVSGTDDRLKRTACLENLLTSPWVNTLKLFFDNNETLTGIHDLIPEKKLWQYFEKALEKGDWSQCLDIVNALPDSMLMESFQIQYFRDKLLSHLIANCTTLLTGKLLQLLYQIKDVHILTQTILSNISDWHINVCEFALLHALRHKDNKTLPSHCKFNMNDILRRVTIFRQMLPYCTDRCNGTWYDVAYCTQNIDPFTVIKSLINADKFELCLEWLECQAFSQKVQSSVTQEFLIGLLKTEEHDFKCTSKLLQALPLSQSLKLCKGALKKMETPNVLQFLANYLLHHCKVTETAKYRRTLVGIEILKHLDLKERMLYIHLIKEPLLMLEQLLMNCKFDTIQRILNVSRESMEQADISLSSFDETIIFYAKKSLDFRVCLQRDGTDTKTKIVHQSPSVEPESNEFVMPVSTPTKEKWVPNDKARECSCCKAVIFSMFNRRHHCRRCGRVVCAVCSQHRMQVSGYPSSVFVRVCDDCKRQTAAQMRAAHGVPSTPSSETFDYWRLTKDEAHDRTIREEFSFEYAPSISLCLSILNLHSDHKAYTNILLDQCDEMKCLLRPVSNGKVNPEVDHWVIIKMIHSLLVAAKVKCAKLGFNTGLTHCDRFLSQVDLITTLARSDCLDLLPSGDLDKRALRKLRDSITEKEQWTLALEVSTKSGLDTLGVWAAWGKACLKVGSFEQARDKFLHCLDKISDDDFDDWVLLSYPTDSTATESCASTMCSYKDSTKETQQSETQTEPPTSKRSEPVRSRPAKDPPLLTEILQILENLSVNSHFIQQNPYDKNKAVYEISNIVNNLKAISLGHFATKVSNPTAQTVYQQESLYYLLTYGSMNSILGHFIKYEEFKKCLAFVLENDLDPEIFFNGVYINSLKNGSNSKLCEAMKTMDPLLLRWRKYLIHICHNLERRQYLHCLYQLQLFMKDSVRAAMTCIRFYANDTTTYTDLCARAQFLLDAQAHLESELQVSILTRKRRKSTGSTHSNSQSITMEMEPCEIDRHINTISRQMEIAKFLGNAEKEGRMPSQFLNIFPDIDSDKSHVLEMPTLFGNQQEKIHLAVLAILCGRNVEEGFGIAFRIMQDYNLPSQKVYSLAGHALAVQSNTAAIEQLIKCCRSSGAPGSNKISDYVLTHCVKLLLNRLYDESGLVQKNQIDTLIRLITDIELKIIAYIDSKQLKAAYLLAVKYSRTQDVRKILKESDRLGQQAIKTICMKWLQQQAKR